MTAALTRIDPNYPVCWEDPDTLRVGFEYPIARLHDPSAGAQRFVGALRRGIDPRLLAHEAAQAGATLAEARTVLEQLGPALRHGATADRESADSTDPPAMLVVMCTGGRDVPALRHALAAGTGCRFIAARPADDALGIDLVILVERYWAPLERAQRWLMAAVPQLIIRFTDGAVHIGPLVSATGGPCHTCLSLERVERDAATAALAAQLDGTPVRSERPETAVLAAAHAAELIGRWRSGDVRAHRTRVIVPVADGLCSEPPSVEQFQPHLQCACSAG